MATKYIPSDVNIRILADVCGMRLLDDKISDAEIMAKLSETYDPIISAAKSCSSPSNVNVNDNDNSQNADTNGLSGRIAISRKRPSVSSLRAKFSWLISSSSTESNNNNNNNNNDDDDDDDDDEMSDPSKKRRMVNKKVRVVDGPDPPPDMPENLKDIVLNHLGGSELSMIYQKKLFASDLLSSQNRLTIPINQLASTKFLSKAEKKEACRRDSNNKIIGINVMIVEPSGETRMTVFKRWKVNNSRSYLLGNNWNQIAKENNLRKGQLIQVWFFRNHRYEPSFAVVKF